MLRFIKKLVKKNRFLKPIHSAWFKINPRISLVLYLSFECDYNCPYCIIRGSGCPERYPKESNHSWEEWVQVINNLPPANVSLTGGEPMLFPGWVSLINNLATKHKISLTTNLSQLPDEFLYCNKKRDLGISASFHPYMADVDSFITRIQKLKEYGFKPSIECVAYPPLLDKLERLTVFLKEKTGVAVDVDPYISPDYRYTKAEIEILKRLGVYGRKFGFDFDGCHILKQCNAGSKHFLVVPNGDVYACHAGFYYVTSPLHKEFSSPKEEFYLGNLFDGSFKPLTKPKLCSLPCSEACDLEGAQVREISK